MHHYGKYKGKKETCSPKIMENPQRNTKSGKDDMLNLRMHQFRDTNSSIRYESRLTESRLNTGNSPKNFDN